LPYNIDKQYVYIIKGDKMENKLATVQDGVVVELVYTLCLDDGEQLDACEEHEAIQFIQGSSGLVKGFTDAVYGLKAGEEKDFIVPPEMGYGAHDPEATMWAAMDGFPDGMTPEIGMEVDVDTGDGELIYASIAEITDDAVLLDLNHVLAGETLHFHVKILSLRAPTAEELAHGHVHS
jgi:FKBP-type peptidyl-prolyl cis-trans isomerase SlyD